MPRIFERHANGTDNVLIFVHVRSKRVAFGQFGC